MSSATSLRYTLEQQAAMVEAAALATEKSRLRVALEERQRLELDCAVFIAQYGGAVPVEAVPRVTGKEASAALHDIIERIESSTADAARRLGAIRDELRRRHLAERLMAVLGEGGLSAPALPTTKRDERLVAAPARQVAVAQNIEVAAERTRRYLGQLDPEAELSDSFLQLAERLLRAEGGAFSHTAADALQAEIGRLNREARELVRISDELKELRVRAGALEPKRPGLDAMVAAADESVRGRRPVDLDPIARAVAEAEEENSSARDAAYVSTVLRDILGTLGYEHVGGFETVVPEHGALLRRPDWSDHGVLLQVEDDEVNMLVVRTVTGTDAPAARASDVVAESEFCDDLPTVMEKLDEHGVTSGARRQVPPNMIKVRVLEGAAPADTKAQPATRRTKPKAKAR